MAVILSYIQKHYPWITVSFTISIIIYSILFSKFIQWIWSRRKMYMLSWKMPGPIALPFLGCVFVIGKIWPIQRALQILFEDSLKYPTPFRFWLGPKFIVVITDPPDLECVLVQNYVPLKPDLYNFWSDGMGNGLLTGHGGAMWRKHRRILNPTFNMNIIRNYQPIINKHCATMIEKVRPLCGTGLVEFKLYGERVCSDIMAETLLNDHETNFQDGHLDYVLNSVAEMCVRVHERMTRFWLHPDIIFKRSNCYKEMWKHRKVIEEYAAEVFNRKRKEFLQNKQMGIKRDDETMITPIDGLIEAQYYGEDLSDPEIIEEIMNVYNAGTDTTYTAMVFLVLMLAMHKNYQDKVFAEIHDYYKDDMDAEVTLEDLKNLPYLDQCFREVLRMYPAGAYLFRIADKDIPLTTKDIVLPEGTTIAVPTYYTYMNEAYWDQPTKYNPDRFSPEECSKRHPYTHIPFCAGPRTCIGQRVGPQTVKTPVVYLIRKFEFYSDWKIEDVPISTDMSVRSLRGYKVHVNERKY